MTELLSTEGPDVAHGIQASTLEPIFRAVGNQRWTSHGVEGHGRVGVGNDHSYDKIAAHIRYAGMSGLWRTEGWAELEPFQYCTGP